MIFFVFHVVLGHGPVERGRASSLARAVSALGLGPERGRNGPRQGPGSVRGLGQAGAELFPGLGAGPCPPLAKNPGDFLQYDIDPSIQPETGTDKIRL